MKFNRYEYSVDGYVIVHLNDQYQAKIDRQDEDILDENHWLINMTNNNPRAVLYRDGTTIHMGRVIMERMGAALGTLVVRHVNGDSLDNRRENLRAVTQSELQQGVRSRTNNTSGCIGVSWDKTNRRWIARIKNDGKTIKKTFHTFEQARDWRKEQEELFLLGN